MKNTLLNSGQVVSVARSIFQSRFLVLNLITLVCLIWTIAVYVIPLTRTAETEGPMKPARSFVVPNIVHFVRYGPANLTFIDLVCILAVLKEQKPYKLYVHTDQQNFVGGKYWEMAKTKGEDVVELKQLHVEGWKIRPDPLVVKLKILQTYGGIYLDNDCYLVHSLNKFRKHHFTVGWMRNRVVPDNVIIASSEAKFLPIWIAEAMTQPSKFSRQPSNVYAVVERKPSLVNWMKAWKIESQEVIDIVYLDSTSIRWMYAHVIKLYINEQHLIPRNLTHKATFPVVFNETNILDYPVNIKNMVEAVFPLQEKQTTLSKSQEDDNI